jgi:hypothetical protein
MGGLVGHVAAADGTRLAVQSTSVALAPPGPEGGLVVGTWAQTGTTTLGLADVVLSGPVGEAPADHPYTPLVAAAPSELATIDASGCSFHSDAAPQAGAGVPTGCVARAPADLTGTDLAPLGFADGARWTVLSPQLPEPKSAPY